MTVNRRAWLKLAALAAGSAGTSVALEAQAAPSGAAAAGAHALPPAPLPLASVVIDHPSSGHDYRPAVAALRRYVDLHLATYGLPGLTLSIADADGFSAVISAGWADIDRRQPVTPDHVFQIGSISKSFAGLAILRLVEAGKLSLDDRVADLLPGVALPDGCAITLRHLLTHTSGLPADAPIFPRGGDGLLWQGFEAGGQFSYSNTGYALVGEIIARAHGLPYSEALKREVLGPLGLDGVLPSIRPAERPRYAIGYAPYYSDRPYARGGRLEVGPWINMTEASGCVAATARQMAVYLRWLIAAGAGPGAPFLSEASRRLFTSPATKAPDFGPEAQYAFGLAIVPVDERPCLHHTGGMLTFSSAITVDAPAGVGAFASVNARSEDEYRPREVTAYALGLMRAVREGRPLPSPRPIRSATFVENAKALAGQYRAKGGASLALTPAGDGLALDLDGASLPLQSAGEVGFVAVGPGEETSRLKLDLDRGAVRTVLWRETLFSAAGADTPPAPPHLARLAGLYDSGSPWTGQMAVVARADGLWLDGAVPLTPLLDGAYRVGSEPGSPERVRFDGDLDGRPQRMNFSGVDLIRL